jgi:hypothetical protein
MSDLPSFLQAGREVFGIFCFRLAPIAVWALVSARFRRVHRLLVATIVALCAVLAERWNLLSWGWLFAGYAYFIGVSATLPLLARLRKAGLVTSGGVFALSAVAFLLVPAVALPEAAKLTLLVLSWEMMLSSYSYCIEVAGSDERPRLGDCLFFVVVNPALVYVQRGKYIGPPKAELQSIGRVAVGVLSLLAAAAVLAPACLFMKQAEYELPGVKSSIAGFAAFGALRFLVEYAQQSGVASLQIGLMRQFGYEIPERFRWPILARDPLDFWRRWNTYVGGWVLRYVFLPLTLGNTQGKRKKTGWFVRVVGITASFVVVGLLHDAYVYANSFSLEGRAFQAFALVAAIVVGWGLIQTFWKRVAGRAVPVSAAFRRAAPALSRAAFWAVLVGCVAWGWR